MSKKLMLLAAGALSALAFAALPAVAMGSEDQFHCSNAAGCTGVIQSTGITTLQDDSGSATGRVNCSAATGTVTIPQTSSTGNVAITFTGCKDGPGFGECQSIGSPKGTIIATPNPLVGHLITIDPTPSVIMGILLTNVNTTFTCNVFDLVKTVTGNVIGKIENPECNQKKSHHTIDFTQGPAGTQTYRQITTTGTMFDLTSGSHAGGGSDATTSAQVGTGHVSWGANTVEITC